MADRIGRDADANLSQVASRYENRDRVLAQVARRSQRRKRQQVRQRAIAALRHGDLHALSHVHKTG